MGRAHHVLALCVGRLTCLHADPLSKVLCSYYKTTGAFIQFIFWQGSNAPFCAPKSYPALVCTKR